jgi:ribosome-binding factor A
MKIGNLRSHNHHPSESHADIQNTKGNAARLKGDHFSEENLVNAAVKFAEAKGKNTGLRFMQELNFNDCNRHKKTDADRILNLSEGTALFLAFDNKAYTIDDPYVKNADIRASISKTLQAKNPDKNIYWLETVGVAEPGSGFFATVPIFHANATTITAGFGFSAGVILRYRTSQPVVENTEISKKVIPVDALSARQLQAGQEFEIVGQGKIRVEANLGIRSGADVGICTAGVGENIGPQTMAALEYSINILSLNGNNKVRVTLRQLDQESVALVSNTAVGLIIPANKLFPGNFGMPQFGHGMLKYFVEHKGPPHFEAYLTDYTSLTLNCSLTHIHKHLYLRSFDFDLDNAKAQEAYNALMRLDLSLAEALSLSSLSNHSVKKLELKEDTYSNKVAMRLALCTEKLFLKEALKSESTGIFTDTAGHHQVYRDEAYKKHHENWFTSKQDTVWEGVNVSVDGQYAKTYYHFNYQKNDFVTRQQEIDRFFSFAQAMGIVRAPNTQSEVVHMHTYKKIFSSNDDSKLDIDLYFTESGVERIKKATQEDFAQAYLETSALLRDRLKLHPLISSDPKLKAACQNIYDRYHMYRYTHPFITPHINNKSLERLAKEYISICGRDLATDYKAIKKSKRFAHFAQKLLAKEQEHKKIANFFTSLGHSHHSYAQGIATLARVAGRENVLVHMLSASGGGLQLRSIDEGAIVHPRQEAIKQLLRKA